MDVMRQMLNELMGDDRDVPIEERNKPKPKKAFTEPDVCKHYLCGFCPYEEFEKTKHDFGPCPHVHDEQCKADWDALPDKERARYPWEKDLKKFLDKMMADLAKKIERNTERLKADETPVLLPEDQAHAAKLSEQIAALVTQSEALGEEGQVDEAQAAAAKAEALKAQKAQFEQAAAAAVGASGPGRYGQQDVCPLSGLIINKEETRIRDHKQGRNYRSWVKAHAKYKELKATIEQRQKDEDSKRVERHPHEHRTRSRSPHKYSRGRDKSQEMRGSDRDLSRGYSSRSSSRHGDRDERYSRSQGRERDDHRQAHGSERPRSPNHRSRYSSDRVRR